MFKFTYAKFMRCGLVLLVFIYHTLLMYIKSNILFRICGKTVIIKEKVIYAFLCGSILFVTDIYNMGIFNFAPTGNVSNVITTISSILVTIIYDFFCIKVLRMPPMWSSEITIYIYLIYQILNSTVRFIDSLIFTSNPTQNDLFMYIKMYLLNFFISLIILKIILYFINHKPNLFIPKNKLYIKYTKGIGFTIFQLCFISLCLILIPILISKTMIGNIITLTILALFFALIIALNNNRTIKAVVKDKESHIQSLASSLNEFRAIKHDFYNILQTYNGYLEIGDIEAFKKYHASVVELTTDAGDSLDISEHINESPAFIALLLSKKGYAKHMNVNMECDLECSITGLMIDTLDLCRLVSCLLDNAIEAASYTKQKLVSFSITQTQDELYLMSITNTSLIPPNDEKMFSIGLSTKTGHEGIGLNTVRKIIEKYPNCTFQMRYSNNNMITHVEFYKEYLLDI